MSTAARVSAASRDTGEKSRIHYRTSVQAGVLDADSRTVFTRGQCHSAAAALAEQDGWGSVVVLVERERYASGYHDDTILHCYAVAPSGNWVDVNGEHAPEQEIASWEDSMRTSPITNSRPTVLVIATDAQGARSLATRAGCEALGIQTDTPLLPTSMPLARSIRATIVQGLSETTRSQTRN